MQKVTEYINPIKRLSSLFRGGFFHILTGSILNKTIALISGIVIARLVDKVEYAYLSYASNIYSYITLVSGLGLSSAILKYCAVQGERSLEKGYMQCAFRLGGAFELAITVLACLAITFADIPYPRSRVYMWAFILTPLLSHMNTCIICYMRTQLENRRYVITGVLNSVLSCCLSIIFVLTVGTTGIIPARYITIVITLAYSYSYYRRTIKNTKPTKLSRKEVKAFLAMGFSMMVAGFFSGIMPLNESFLVNNIIRDEIVTATFRVAGQFPQLLLIFSGAATVYFFPIVAKMTDYRAIRKKVIRIGALNGLLIILLAGMGMLLTPIAFRLLYTGKYDDAVSISYTLWLMRAANCCLRMIPMNILPALGKTKFNAYLAFSSCIAQVLIDYLLITRIGIKGVAYGAIIVYFSSAILYWWYFLSVCRKGEKRQMESRNGGDVI